MTYDICFSIAGSDPSGGAGIQADLKTFSALGCYGAAAITALTVQNTQGVQSSIPVEAQFVKEQIKAVMEDLRPKAIKIGMVANTENILAIRDGLSYNFRYYPQEAYPFIILDPILVSSSGHLLLEKNSIEALITELMPICNLITPNLPELQALTNETILDNGAYKLIERTGCPNILVKGGHRSKDPIDVLFSPTQKYIYKGERIKTHNTHGTGCTLSSAIAAYIAQGSDLPHAIAHAKQYVTTALRTGQDVTTGHGKGPMNHFFNPKKLIIEEN